MKTFVIIAMIFNLSSCICGMSKEEVEEQVGKAIEIEHKRAEMKAQERKEFEESCNVLANCLKTKGVVSYDHCFVTEGHRGYHEIAFAKEHLRPAIRACFLATDEKLRKKYKL